MAERQRSANALRGRIGAFRLHATHDPRETTRAARDAFMRRFEHEVDPASALPEESVRAALAQPAARTSRTSPISLRRYGPRRARSAPTKRGPPTSVEAATAVPLMAKAMIVPPADRAVSCSSRRHRRSPVRAGDAGTARGAQGTKWEGSRALWGWTVVRPFCWRRLLPTNSLIHLLLAPRFVWRLWDEHPHEAAILRLHLQSPPTEWPEVVDGMPVAADVAS